MGRSRNVRVREIERHDEAIWRELWSGYLTFYEASLPDATTHATWARILDPGTPFLTTVAESDGEVTGFANVVIHPFTWSERPACLLHDLFVRPDIRGGGVGRALIQDLIDRGKTAGWDRIYWLTREDNATARRLYDTFAPADGFIRYKVLLR
ncbi:MAG TPA: GNAT family N-acetyltransferase [Thermomicrobiales bacterium]|nr:GNAT family N-acetyltransferase [Thermomicrobiales bacterium]